MEGMILFAKFLGKKNRIRGDPEILKNKLGGKKLALSKI